MRGQSKWFIEFHLKFELQKIIKKNKRRKNKKDLRTIGSSGMYCLCDFGGLHSNLKNNYMRKALPTTT